MNRNLRNKSTIPALFAEKVMQHPDKPALIYEATGEVTMFPRKAKSTVLAAALRQNNNNYFPLYVLQGLEF